MFCLCDIIKRKLGTDNARDNETSSLTILINPTRMQPFILLCIVAPESLREGGSSESHFGAGLLL